MSVAEPDPTAPAPGLGGPGPLRRPRRKRATHLVRRAHLYSGLFLLPWAVLYGVTGFLFNHPTAFSDAPTASFGAGELAGTPMEGPPKPAAVAEQVVAALNERAKDSAKYSLVEPEKTRYTRDFAFATVKAGGQEVSLLFDVSAPGGTNAKWFWAVVVDAMAFVMVFWGASGLFMWWQLKGARLPGFAVLLCSAAAATALGFGMHELLLAK